MRVYVVDNGGQWTHREWRVLKYLGVETKIVPNTTPVGELKGVDGLVLSGGAPRVGVDASAMGRNGEYIDRAGVPVLGICAGHQYMALHLGGDAKPSKVPEFGKARRGPPRGSGDGPPQGGDDRARREPDRPPPWRDVPGVPGDHRGGPGPRPKGEDHAPPGGAEDRSAVDLGVHREIGLLSPEDPQ